MRIKGPAYHCAFCDDPYHMMLQMVWHRTVIDNKPSEIVYLFQSIWGLDALCFSSFFQSFFWVRTNSWRRSALSADQDKINISFCLPLRALVIMKNRGLFCSKSAFSNFHIRMNQHVKQKRGGNDHWHVSSYFFIHVMPMQWGMWR